jgi:cholesterol oxidase
MRSCDAVVVGSGFGGSVAALRLAEKGYAVAVLEAGRRFGADDFARTSWDLRRFLYAPRLGCHGIQRITLLRDVVVLSGAGVGGGSLVYAGVLYEPPASVWEEPGWAAELEPYYVAARRMIGVARVPFAGPADAVLREVAGRMGVGATYRPTDVGVWFGGSDDDGYEGPSRSPCVFCGGCMVGCRHGAKNTLDRNYLWHAERLGAEVFPEHEATALHRSEDGWIVETRRGAFRAPHVVLAAGTLGTLKLLLRSRVGGPHVGERVRTNAEALVGATRRRAGEDFSRGVAIGSSFDPEAGTQIQAVRYPRGSNAMGLLGRSLPGSGRGAFVRSLSVRRWSERTVILLAMQARDATLHVRWTGRRLTTQQVDNPTRMPVAERAAGIAAGLIGGDPGGPLLPRAMTAHVLGGCCVGSVVDRFHRVVSEPGLHVVDGSAVNANLGVNPSLTIAAQAERALALWPGKGEPDERPPLEA